MSEPVERFVFRLLGSGLMLSELVQTLGGALATDRYPGEEPVAVALEMMCGTIATALEPLDPREVVRSAELIELAHQRAIEHVKLACALSRRMHGEDGGVGRIDG